MRIYLTNSTNPFYNLAVEEYLLRNSDEDIFMLWQNEPSIIIGRNQNFYNEVELEEVEKRHVHVARRITGGGAVYHDLGNINFSFITSKEKAQILDFAYFTEPVVRALKGLGIDAKLSGRNDLIARVPENNTVNNGTETLAPKTAEKGIFEGNGVERNAASEIWAKFSGNAQAQVKDRILHHGTLLFDSDLTVLSTVLKPDILKLKSKAIKSVRSRVTNLKSVLPEDKKNMTTRDFFEYLVSFVEKEWNGQREVVPETDVLETGLFDRNESDDYNRGRKEHYDFEAKEKFDSGIVILLWNEENDVIKDFKIEGDFFGEKDAWELSDMLKMTPKKEFGMKLKALGIGDYIQGVTPENLLKMMGIQGF